MSHFSRIKTQFAEKIYLLQALKDLGYETEEGNLNVRGFAGNQTPVDILVRLRVSYDIGFRWNNGAYEIVADWFGVRGIKPKEFENKLAQKYAYYATRAKLEEQGFSLVQETQEGGNTRLVLRRTV